MVKKVTDRSAVEAAMDEFDAIGRKAFLEKYHFGPAIQYFVTRNGRRYDSKAIYGVAHQIQFPEDGPPNAAKFSGGELPVKGPLEALGFEFVAEGGQENEVSGGIEQPHVWIEKCLVKNRDDRKEGPHRLGEALWSPQKAKNGGDLYANMRRVAPEDIVLHLTDNAGFSGISKVAEPVDDSFVGLPNTDWADQPGYRVQLALLHKSCEGFIS